MSSGFLIYYFKKERSADMTNTPLLEEYIKKSGYKKSHIAKVVGLTAYGLALKINNVNEFKVSEVDALCKLLGIESLEEKDRIFFAVGVDLESISENETGTE
jgi:hypothetical protein